MDIDLRVLKLMESEKGVSFDELVGIIEQAIRSAYQKHVTQASGAKLVDAPDARVELDKRTGIITIFEIEHDEDGNVSSEKQVNPDDFGRIAAHAAKQVINQRLRAIADEATMGEFKGKVGDIVAGVVQQASSPHMVHVDLGTVEAMMPLEEQVPGEEYTHGRRMRFYVVGVDKGAKGPSIKLSRKHPQLVRKLFALEVPEIASGLVEIAAIAREAGHRTKIAVLATDPSVNAKGACIGVLGRRVRAVTEELNDEKIDIVDYSPDLATFVANALSPAKVTKAVVVEESLKAVRAFVPDFQVSLAIGPKSQNVRLAHRLTGARIDIQPDSGLAE